MNLLETFIAVDSSALGTIVSTCGSRMDYVGLSQNKVVCVFILVMNIH